MSLEDTRLQQIRAKCEAFHRKHPEVWDMFVRFTLDRINLGFKNYSADAIFHRIRWETASPLRGEDDFKLNNDFTAFYARRFHKMHPEHHGFFRTREQKSAVRRPQSLPELRPSDYPTTNE